MSFNLLKHYPDILEIMHLSPNERDESLKGIYRRDIENNELFYFKGKRIYPTKHDGEITLITHFKHLTSEETEEVDDNGNIVKRRVFDKYRSERLHWIKTHTDETTGEANSDIEIFSYIGRNLRKRSDVKRTYIYNKKQKYVIVFEPQNSSSYYLLTAYYLNKDYGVKQIEKQLKKKVNTIL